MALTKVPHGLSAHTSIVDGASSTAITIDADGNVGIGVSAPTRNLVLGNSDSTGVQTQYTNSTTGAALGDGFTVGIDGSENAEFWNFENTNMLFATNGTERMRLDSSGNVGINDTTPTATLDILNNNVAQVTLNVQSPGSDDAHVAQISRGSGSHKGSGLKIVGANYTNGTNTSAAFLELAAGQYSGSNTKYIHAYDNSGTDFMVGGDGNVGIGTDSPTQTQVGSVAPKLHVKADGTVGSYDLVARFEAGNDSSQTGASILINHSNDRGLLIEGGRDTGGDISVGHLGVTNSGGTNTRAITILAAGQVIMPNQPAFRTYLSTERTTDGLINSGWTDTSSSGVNAYDRGGDFNTSNGRFTAPVDGVYHFDVMWDSNASQGGINLHVTGTGHTEYNVRWEPTGRTDDSWESKSYSTSVQMDTGDYVELYAVHCSGANPIHMGSGHWGFFAGHLVS